MHGRAQCSTMGPRLYEVAIAFITIYFKRFSQMLNTGKSLSEALNLVSTNPQYDDRLFIELRVQYMKIASSEHVENMLCTQIVFCFCFDIQNTVLLKKIYLYQVVQITVTNWFLF